MNPRAILASIRHGSVFDDLDNFLRKHALLRTSPGAKGEEFVDLRDPESKGRRVIEFLLSPDPPGKRGKLVLGPRGMGKSTICRALCLGTIEDDPYSTHRYNAQTVDMGDRSVIQIRSRIEQLRPDLVGEELWKNDRFLLRVRKFTADVNPTVESGAPGKDVTGGRPEWQWFDDLVCFLTNRTYRARRKLLEWYLSTSKQFSPRTRLRAIGTEYEGHNLWTEICDHHGDEFEIMRIGVWEEKTGKLYFPWMNVEFLEQQRKHDPTGFRRQYMNERVTSDDQSFDARFLAYGEPAMDGEKISPDLNLYMTTDTAMSDRKTKGASRTALWVGAKDSNGYLWIVDGTIGRWESSMVEKKIMGMWERWMDHGLILCTLEDRGPSRAYISTIPELAMALKRPIPSFRMVPRASTDEKDSRIAMLYAPFANGKIRFSKKFIDPAIFRIDAVGEPHGIFVDEYLNYDKEGECYRDALDAMADFYTVIKGEPVCPNATRKGAKKAEPNRYDWSVQRALGNQDEIIEI
jgi:hypothetical protein